MIVAVSLPSPLGHAADGDDKKISIPGFQKTGRLTGAQEQRLEACRRLMPGISARSFEAARSNLEKSPYPEENLQIFEAMARAYNEIVAEEKITGSEKKEWLFSMIKLNMAYLQLGGINLNQAQDTVLNRLIRRTLKEQLPAGLMENKNIFHSSIIQR